MDFTRVFDNAMPLLLNGLGLTVLVSVAGIILGLLLGLIICFMDRSKVAVLRGHCQGICMVRKRNAYDGSGAAYLFCVPAAYSAF